MKNNLKLKRAIIVASICVMGITACSDKNTSAEYITSAEKLTVKNQNKAAILELKNALRLAPDNAEIRALLGSAYLKVGDVLSAESEFKKALTKGLEPKKIIRELSRTYLLLNKEDELKQLLGINDLDEEQQIIVNIYIGIMYIQNSEIKKAESYITQASELSEDSLYSKLGMLWLKSSTSSDEAISAVEELLKVDNTLSEAILLKAHLLRANGDVLDAASIYDDYLNLHPLAHHVKIFKASALVEAEKFAEAEVEIDFLLNLYSNLPILNELKAITRFYDNDFQSAENYARKSMQMDPERSLATLIGGISSFKLNNIEQAYRYLIILDDKLKDGGIGKKLLAITRLKLGYLNDITNEYSADSDISDFDIQMLTAASKAIAQQGNQSEAKKVLQNIDSSKITSIDKLTQLGLLKLSLADSEGLKDLQKAVDLNSENIESKIVLVVSLISKNRLDEAEKLLATWIQDNPSEPNLKVALAEVNIRRQNYALAEFELKEIASEYPKNISSRFRLSQLLQKQNNNVEALALLKQIIAINSKHGGALSGLVTLSTDKDLEIQDYLLSQWRTDKSIELSTALAKSYAAIKEHTKAVDILDSVDNKESSRHYILIGDLYLDAQNIEAAEKAYSMAIVKNSADIQAITKYALSLEMQRKYQKALEVIQRGLNEVKSNIILELLEVNYLLFTNQIQLAENKFNSYNIKDSNQPITYTRLGGQIALAQQKFNVAIIYLEELVKLENMKKNVLMLAMAYAGNLNIEGAIATLNKFLEKGDNIDVRANLAQIYMSTNLALAKEQYLILIKQLPDNFLIHNNLAFAAVNTNDIALAIKHADKAFELAPENPQVIDTLGFIKYMQQDYSQALKYYKQANALAPNDRGIIMHMANCLIKMDRTEEAKVLLATINK
ncbi:XrtA/PEP-CTERM system TPR-repeat protein PrsT [Colwellia hornerae]|uniref:PEP-CTERM system TPR-repeat protein PrsT n=1 Tax=Colwellia hornerae TaxID=89402 RepID=A0A5C6QGX8_9GAMM|nr:XrtA/PEP-CTERM system TPR-repeat protein PrsT [Colwellia hornerae]TWX52480.1 PEP-CTERM system TPR-repeat protein PrsT [Colwellia hornerae]TWX58309.1 PEP-CTERM system TPR-repeat protein PrsT [Colwellia hornerae]TWX68346.1 PEP-CTERM system TPR-repeat protein PrsT [Colwellia hornerae]